MISSVHIIGSRQFGGAERFFLRLTHGLHEAKHRVTAVIRPASPLRSLLNANIPQHHVAMRNGWDVLSVWRIRRLINHLKPAIVQTYMGRATRLTRLPADKSAVHIARLGGYYKIKGYYEHADAWVANTRGLCDYLIQQGLASDRIFYIGNPVEAKHPPDASKLAELRNECNIAQDAIVIFSLGRFVEIKGFDDLLTAFGKLPREISSRPLHLVIAGDGPLRKQLHALARRHAFNDRLRWVGWQSDPTPYYHLADVFVCPSHRETLGNVILEAWAHRLPVVATRTPGAQELIIEGQNGLLTALKDPQALAATILEIIRGGPREWQRLAQNGWQKVVQHHSQDAIVNDYLNMYTELSARSGRS